MVVPKISVFTQKQSFSLYNVNVDIDKFIGQCGYHKKKNNQEDE